jgi:hypothetical protein
MADNRSFRTHEHLSKDRLMPFRTREKAEHAKQEQHFKDIEKSLKDASELLVTSKREIERSKRIMKGTDQPDAPPQRSERPTNDR